ncbi:beta-glucosidase BglX [Pedobacter heparinus]|uniref:Periplasmic beta-glucosidase n=1 Tax=Pedobacter heparinus (strain ATCC 13125 / DSM 2366 / CIP 104194 / JCM 7457 / NBRC 12017 / NCIMB 9290 / NRRL B-14731 / HIM 762-3) TaxID=485917 RepID=C6XU36_PEDHD|nr:beta-glucosidase BglX [Pedobacter heparinus]ACU05829.1 glycoside hydrolase family 3 domain protein [Pedobacter heparinus DSM 2366]
MKIANLFILTLIFTAHITFAQTKKTGKATHQQMNTFISNLMSKMTLDEKIGQLNLLTGGEATTGSVVSTDVESKIKKGQVGGIFSLTTPARIRKAQEIAVNQTRLKIPIIFGQDVIHGYKTTFPIPLALSSTWNMEMIKKTARIAAIEATADGLNWTFSPMVDISRDPRWGRISEGSGEDTYLGSEIARAMVKGYQGDDLAKYNTMMACVKHFALYGASEAGRDYNTTDMSLDRMYNEYLPPYKAALDAGAGSIMTSFNDINGVPATANKWLMTDLLRKEWGFKGLVVTDYTAVNELIDHGLGDLKAVSALSINAGVDMDMVGEGFLTTLKKSVQEGKVKAQRIDEACRLVLEAKYKLGLFDDPFRYCNEERAKTEILKPEHLAFAREVAAESFVLLKNENQTLPLKKTGTIALIGPLANTGANMPGTWSVNSDLANTASLLTGMKAVLGKQVKVVHCLGSNLVTDEAYQQRATMFGRDIPRDNRPEAEVIKEAVELAKTADVVIAALGESSEMSGEASSRTNLEIPEVQQRLLQALLKTGKPVVLVLFTGRPLVLNWEQQNVPAILNVWFGGTETAKAITDVLFGDVNPSGKLTATFPQNVGQIPLYYAHKNTGRPLADGKWFSKFRSNYLDVSNEPLYPFGYGLSYTSFAYSNLRLSKNSFKPGESITASIDIKNIGSREGKEVVQLYIRDLVGSSTRPVKELKAFQKISLKPGESKTVSFKLTENDLKFYNTALRFVAEPGDFNLFIGGNSRDVLETKFSLRN